MNHSFSPSITDTTKCRVCKFDEVSHTEHAICECCSSVGVAEVMYGNILMCKACQDKEKALKEQSVATAETRVADMNALLEKNRQIDTSIKILPDIFNAKILAIAALRKEIENSGVENPQFVLAKVMDERYTHLRGIVTGLRTNLSEAENEQRAITQYYNQLAKTLREDERAQIKLKDVAYQPVEPKQVSKPKAPTVKSQEKEELRDYANRIEHEFPEQKGLALGTLSVFKLQKNTNAKGAYEFLKNLLSNAKNKGN